MRNDILDPIFIFITSLGNAGLIWIIATIICLIFPRTRKAGIISAMALILSLLINNLIIKNAVARVRPYDVSTNLISLVGRQKDYSFPSGHSAASFAAGVAFLRNLPKKYGVPAIILAGLIAFSRLYVGVHYPSDVIAGILSGTLLAIIAQYVYERICTVKSLKTNK